MKTLLLASTVAVAVANVSPAFADDRRMTFGTGYLQEGAISQAVRVPHWEWQYGISDIMGAMRLTGCSSGKA
jgi:hypothetical protein